MRALLQPGFYAYAARRFAGAARQLVRDYVNRPALGGDRLRVGEGAVVGRGAIFSVEPDIAPDDPARFDIGAGAWIEDGAELGLTPGAQLSIGAHTSIHRDCVVLGDVRIGANCIFSYNIYVAAGSHVVDVRPPWLIRDQDRAFAASRPRESVRIDDDVWVGWGVFIKSGVRVGRGAVIGANAVVLDDVEPYAFHAGAPARKLGERLAFSPPASLDAMRDDCLPYFYSGFEHAQATLGQSRALGGIGLTGRACMALSPNAAAVRIRGHVTEGTVPVTVMVSVGGGAQQAHHLALGEFDLRVEGGGEAVEEPAFLRGCTLVYLDPGENSTRILVRGANLDPES